MITALMSANVYVDDFEKAAAFYEQTLGLTRGISMGDQSCFFHIGENPYGLFLDGGYRACRVAEDQSRAAFTFSVESAHALAVKLRAMGAEVLGEGPKDMGKGYFWFQFRDPAGNILEAISGPRQNG